MSSGKKINSAADDAAGLAISDKMKSQIRGLDMAAKNAEDGVSLVQTAEGSMNEVSDMLQRMRELAIQATNGTNTQEDRAKIQREVQQLEDEIDALAGRTQFNKQNIGTGALSAGITLQIGANKDQTLKVAVSGGALQTSALGISDIAGSFTDVASLPGIISNLDTALAKVAESRAQLGAYQNRLEHKE